MSDSSKFIAELIQLNRQNDNLRALNVELLAALTAMLDRYASLADSGDAGNWDCEEVDDVIAARAAIAKATGEPS
jgi:hypothetical protein